MLKVTTKVDPARARVMRAVKSKDTKTEMIVRRLVHSLGYRYRLHRSELPGNPDIVFPSRRSVIFVHGCFWHGHVCKRGDRIPKTNSDYWIRKINRNRERDQMAIVALKTEGWRSLIIWECETKNPLNLEARITEFLGA